MLRQVEVQDWVPDPPATITGKLGSSNAMLSASQGAGVLYLVFTLAFLTSETVCQYLYSVAPN